MGIPEAREELFEIASKLDRLAHPEVGDELRRVVARHMHRNMVKPRRAPTEAATVTPAVRDAIKMLVAASPNMSNVEIGRRYDLNPGRVSEILAGHYD
jgi:hypothetical protein